MIRISKSASYPRYEPKPSAPNAVPLQADQHIFFFSGRNGKTCSLVQIIHEDSAAEPKLPSYLQAIATDSNTTGRDNISAIFNNFAPYNTRTDLKCRFLESAS
jgi:hypothetical protein